MTNTEFSINSVTLSYKISDFPLEVNSFPNPYSVTTIGSLEKYQEILASADFIIIDRNVSNMYKFEKKGSAYVLEIEATEENKKMDTVLKLIDSMIEASVSKGSIVMAVGGGIIQDITACACALFRRGQPFNYLPTTSLGQLDSCVGAFVGSFDGWPLGTAVGSFTESPFFALSEKYQNIPKKHKNLKVSKIS